MPELLDAIEARYAASAGDALRALGVNGFYHEQQPDRAQEPFIRFHIINEPLEWADTGGTQKEIQFTVVQFSIFSDSQSRDQAVAIFAALKTAFDDFRPTGTSFNYSPMRREFQLPQHEFGGWHYATRYRVEADEK